MKKLSEFLTEQAKGSSDFEKELSKINKNDYYERLFKEGKFNISLKKCERTFHLSGGDRSKRSEEFDGENEEEFNSDLKPLNLAEFAKSDYTDDQGNFYEVKYDISNFTRFLTWNFDKRTSDEFIKNQVGEILNVVLYFYA